MSPSIGLEVSSETLVKVFSVLVDFQVSPDWATSSLESPFTVETLLLSTTFTWWDRNLTS